MERFLSISPLLASLWVSQVGRPVSIRARNSMVAMLAALRDALRAPRRVMSLTTGQIDRLPWTMFDGQKIPLVGAIPQPEQWSDGPHSEAYEGRARVLSDAISEVFRELAITGQLVPRTASQTGTAPGGAAVSFEEYVGKVGVIGDVLLATIPERAEKDSDEPQLILEDRDLVRRVHDVFVAANLEKASMLVYLNDPRLDAAVPANLASLSSNAVVTEMAQRAINARRAGNMTATLFFTGAAVFTGIAMSRNERKDAICDVIQSF